MEKIYKVQMNSKGMPDFSTAVEIPPSDNHDWEKYSDRLWKIAYEKGKEDEKRWWSGFCAKCTDADRPQGKWIDCKGGWKCTSCNKWSDGQYTFCPHCGAKMKGIDNE